MTSHTNPCIIAKRLVVLYILFDCDAKLILLKDEVMVWRRLFTSLFVLNIQPQIPLFKYGPNGKLRNKKNILGRRNYCIVYYEEESMSLVFDIRAEKEKGVGTTVRYVK